MKNGLTLKSHKRTSRQLNGMIDLIIVIEQQLSDKYGRSSAPRQLASTVRTALNNLSLKLMECVGREHAGVAPESIYWSETAQQVAQESSDGT